MRSGSCWDHVGTSLSLLCVVHCMTVPMLLALWPAVVSTRWLGTGVHRVFATAAVVAGGMALIPGYRQHRRLFVPLLGGLGVIALLFAAFGPAVECCVPLGKLSASAILPVMFNSLCANPVTTMGSGLLLTAHALNQSWRHQARRTPQGTQSNPKELCHAA